jgi:hypothetical protein
LQDSPKFNQIGILDLKIYHLATLKTITKQCRWAHSVEHRNIKSCSRVKPWKVKKIGGKVPKVWAPQNYVYVHMSNNVLQKIVEGQSYLGDLCPKCIYVQILDFHAVEMHKWHVCAVDHLISVNVFEPFSLCLHLKFLWLCTRLLFDLFDRKTNKKNVGHNTFVYLKTSRIRLIGKYFFRKVCGNDLGRYTFTYKS